MEVKTGKTLQSSNFCVDKRKRPLNRSTRHRWLYAAYVVSFVSLLHTPCTASDCGARKSPEARQRFTAMKYNPKERSFFPVYFHPEVTRAPGNGIRPIRPVFWSYNWLACFLVRESKRILYNAYAARLRSVFQERFQHIFQAFFKRYTKDIERIKTFLIQSIKWKNSEVKDLGFGCKRRANPRVGKKKKKKSTRIARVVVKHEV